MPAPIGHPPYNAKGEGGRPLKYTEEYINQEADNLIEWMKTDGNILFKKYALLQGYHPCRLSEFAEQNERFAKALALAKSWQEMKISEGGLTKEYSGDISKFMLVNCHAYTDKVRHEVSTETPVPGWIKESNSTSKDLVKDD